MYTHTFFVVDAQKQKSKNQNKAIFEWVFGLPRSHHAQNPEICGAKGPGGRGSRSEVEEEGGVEEGRSRQDRWSGTAALRANRSRLLREKQWRCLYKSMSSYVLKYALTRSRLLREEQWRRLFKASLGACLRMSLNTH